MKLEQVTAQEKVARIREILEDAQLFDEIAEEVARATLVYDSSHYVQVYWNAEKSALCWFPIEQNSSQPLVGGDCYVSSIRCGSDVLHELDAYVQRDEETGDLYIPADELHERIDEENFVAYLFGDYCDASAIVESTRDALIETARHKVEEVLMYNDID